MKVLWIVPGHDLLASADGVRSDLASIRYRALIPARALNARGHAASVLGLSSENFDEVRKLARTVDRVVFIKNYYQRACSERMLAELRVSGVKTLFDLTDDRFSGEHAGHLQYMAGNAGSVVTVSWALREIIKQHTGKDSQVVGDPYEGPRGEPRWTATQRLKGLWFGHKTNFASLEHALPALLKAGTAHPMDLRIVTAEIADIERFCKTYNSKHRHALALRYAAWSQAETWKSLAQTDFVIIPALLNSPGTLAKSPNRIIEALWAGRFVVAHPIPSYMEFQQWAWLGPDLAEGVGWMAENPEMIVPRIAASQNYIARTYSPDTIGEQWERILEQS